MMTAEKVGLNPKDKKKDAPKRHETAFIVKMLFFPFAQWLVFWLYVNLSSISLAFKDLRTGAFTFDNFVTFWESLTAPYGDINIALKNTLIYFSTTMFIISPISLLIAYFLYKQIAFYKGFRVIFYLPAIVSSVAMVAVYCAFIDPKGPLDKIISLFGGSIPGEGLLARAETATATIVAYTIWTGFCSNVLLFSGAMTRIPVELLESARLEGCGAMREFFQLIFPLIWPTTSTLIIVTCTGVFNSSGPILLFTNGKFETTTLAFWIFEQVYGNGAIGGTGSYNLVSCTGLVFTLIGMPIVLLLRWIMDKVPTVEY